MLYPVCHRKVPLAVESVTSTSPCPSDGSALLPNHTLTAPLEGVSMLSYSTSVSQNGAGVFCIRDPEPGPRLQRNKPARPPKASGEGPGPRKRKAPPTSESGACRKSGNSYHLPPGSTLISNGTAALSVRAKPRPGGQGPRDQDRYGGVEPSLPQALTGDHGGVSSHSPLPGASSDGRKRKSSGSSAGGDKPSKTSKSTALDGIFRKSSAGLLSSVAEAAHSALPRQVTLSFGTTPCWNAEMHPYRRTSTLLFCMFFNTVFHFSTLTDQYDIRHARKILGNYKIVICRPGKEIYLFLVFRMTIFLLYIYFL